MSVVDVWTGGFRRVRRAPSLVLLLWICSAAITVPPALALAASIRTHLGASLEADEAADNVNFDWMQEFRAQAGPLGRTLRPDVIGFAAVLDNTSALAEVDDRPMVVVVCGIVFVALLWLLTPGMICRLAADRRLAPGETLGVSGAFFFRMVRMSVVSSAIYAALFFSLHASMFDDAIGALTENTSVERTAFFIRLAFYVVFFLIVAAVNVLLDVAKIRLVVEDRRSILAALAAAAAFIGNNARMVLGGYVLNVAALGVVIGVYGLTAPGAAGGFTAWSALAIGELYVAARLAVRLAFWGAEIVALQTRFGCPGFCRSVIPSNVGAGL